MADIYYIRIGSVHERHVLLHCLTGFTSDGTNYESSRSFALSVLLDAKDHADDYTYLAGGAPERIRHELMRLAKRAAVAASPLHDAVPAPIPWETSWHLLTADVFRRDLTVDPVPR